MKDILITCDTEVGELGSILPNGFELFIEGKVNGQEVGYRLINSIASNYNAVVEHYVDIYPYERYGENKYRILCQNIVNEGHKIGLHTHPASKYDITRKFMHQYSFEEQKTIIMHGKNKIQSWIGYSVMSHRAGGYGADINTIKALNENNLLIDTSFYFRNENCKITYKYKNKSSFIHDVLEIPITIYNRQKFFSPFNISKSFYTKLDFRYGSNSHEILDVIKKMPDPCTIVIFLHSFNFLIRKYDFNKKKFSKISIDKYLIEEYHKLLKGIQCMKDTRFNYSSQIVSSENYQDEIISLYRKEFIINSIYTRLKVYFSNKMNV